MYPSDYGRVLEALAALMKEQGNWTPEAAYLARYFRKATGIRATLPPVETVECGVFFAQCNEDHATKKEIQ